MLHHRKSTGSRKHQRGETHLAQSLWTFVVAAAVAGLALYQMGSGPRNSYQPLARDPAFQSADLPSQLPPELNSSRF